MSIQETIKKINWQNTTHQLMEKGFSIVPDVLSPSQCDDLIQQYDNPDHYRKTIRMERYRFGLGEYKYFKYPLPSLLDNIRTLAYPFLAPVANEWATRLRTGITYPDHFKEFQQLCHNQQQTQATALILKYETGGHNTLHQDLYGDLFFPIQAVFFLSKTGVDYKGGEFVLTEQIPRAQSKAIVLNPAQGSMLLFTTNYRPARGKNGYYRVNMKHGVSEVQEGRRFTLGIIFHDAAS